MESKNEFARYLKSKISVDDRALNLRVWNEMIDGIKQHKDATPISILEVGGGIGTMITRILSEEITDDFRYTLVDLETENIEEGKKYILNWAKQNSYDISILQPNEFVIFDKQKTVTLSFLAKDVYQFVGNTNQKFELIIAHAFLDLLDISIAIPKLFQVLNHQGCFYFTINYDGVSIFEPVIDAKLENLILSEYNLTMDERITNGVRSGDSQTGRHLFNHIIKNHGEIIEVGSSDWVVFPKNGKYIEDEEYFLLFIIQTIENALRENNAIPQIQLNKWCDQKHKQIERKELIFIAHQFDFYGKLL